MKEATAEEKSDGDGRQKEEGNENLDEFMNVFVFDLPAAPSPFKPPALGR